MKRKVGCLNKQPEMPSVAVVISVYNEEDIITDKLQNLTIIDYPKGKIEFYIGSDASNDNTNDILSQSKQFNIHTFPYRRGKAAVLNSLISMASCEIIVFSDANTFFTAETIQNLVRHFSNSTIGAVCGELVLHSQRQTMGSFGEKSYWNYENALKRLESEISTTLGASGAVYAIRRNLFKPLPTTKSVTDDFLIPLNIVKQGYRTVYDPEALAYEKVSGSVVGEFRRKVRIGAANFHGIVEFASLLHPRYGFVSFALWSHKIIRWLIPLILPYVFVAPLILSMNSSLYGIVLNLEAVFVAMVVFGFIAEKFKLHIGFFGLPFYFIAMNIALFVGFLKFIFKLDKPTWDVIR